MLLNSEQSSLPGQPGLLTSSVQENGAERGICYEPAVLEVVYLLLQREDLILVNMKTFNICHCSDTDGTYILATPRAVNLLGSFVTTFLP